MKSLRLAQILCVFLAACNYMAPFDSNDQPLRPSDAGDSSDNVDGGPVDGDVEDGGPCEPDCDGQRCGPDGCGGLCDPGCEGEGDVCIANVDHSPEATYRCSPPTPGRWVFLRTGETFTMGSPTTELGREASNEELHEVTLTHDFIIYSSEFSQGEVGGMLQGRDPSTIVSDQNPGEHLTWHEAAAATNHMSFELGLPECYQCEVDGEHQCQLDERWSSPQQCPGFRLPTEAEWEYAARAGSSEATYAGDLETGDEGCREDLTKINDVAWFCGNAQDSTHPTGSKFPNDFGLYDMLGNVGEWCHDVYVIEYGEEISVDPWGPTEGTLRTYRGGTWEDDVDALRAAARDGLPPDSRLFIGLRPVRTVQ